MEIFLFNTQVEVVHRLSSTKAQLTGHYHLNFQNECGFWANRTSNDDWQIWCTLAVDNFCLILKEKESPSFAETEPETGYKEAIYPKT